MISMIAALLLQAQIQVTTPLGVLEGEESKGIRIYRGVPFAQPPTGKLRFAAPAPAAKWEGTKNAKSFGHRCMQHPLFGDMNFRDSGMSEDCLFLNIWTPARSRAEKLPVLVYFFGGGSQAGDGSEPRYDGESMARKGIVSVTVNYRLGVFGFLAHPALSADAKHRTSGNYGLMDQSEALRWVKKNIASFGGDPERITIAGESAGSSSVSAQMASPLSKDLIAGAIGESGSVISAARRMTLKEAEAQGEKFAASIGLNSAEALRSAPAQTIFEASGKAGVPRFNFIVDGYFLPEFAGDIFRAGKQARVPLLAGWNSEEGSARTFMAGQPFTVANFRAAVERVYKQNAEDVLKAYVVTRDEDVEMVARSLAGDAFTGLSTWRWIDLASKTGGKPVYRYFYERARPKMTPEFAGATANLAGGVTRGPANAAPRPLPKGAVHSAEIEYALGNLDLNKVYAWEPEDHQVSKVMQEYFANFIKTGDPNGKGLPKWPAVQSGSPVPVMHIDVKSRVEPEQNRNRYELLERLNP